ncbi:hypothetical protein ACQPZQ_30405 [Pseudonocardia sp. CA-142604]|uniref:hypothetical protein n=1 Tax=Pseudonocardia sp. CA-142604 TaxID=3240024 RepID=UPI003D941C73
MDASTAVAGISLCGPTPRWSAFTRAAGHSAHRISGKATLAGRDVDQPGSRLAVVSIFGVDPIHPAKSISPERAGDG